MDVPPSPLFNIYTLGAVMLNWLAIMPAQWHNFPVCWHGPPRFCFNRSSCPAVITDNLVRHKETAFPNQPHSLARYTTGRGKRHLLVIIHDRIAAVAPAWALPCTQMTKGSHGTLHRPLNTVTVSSSVVPDGLQD